MEGENVGEYGTGFNNSNYWWGTVGSQHGVMGSVYMMAVEESEGCGREMVGKMNGQWKPIEFVNICERALRARDSVAIEWCERVQKGEILLMSEYVLNKMQDAGQ